MAWVTIRSGPKVRRLTLSTTALAACALATGGQPARAAAVFTTVGTYDEQTTSTNVVDTVADGTTSGTAVTGGDAYNTFKTNVAAAFIAGRGGVIDFEGPGNNDLSTAFTTTYAAGAKTLAITSSPGVRIANVPTSSAPISGVNVVSGATAGPTDVVPYGFTFGPITGGSVGEAVTEVGYTLVSRTGYPVDPTPFTITATFSGGGNSALTSSISSAVGTDDTFYRFVAPAGQSITGIAISSNQGSRPTFADDLGYITSIVPEPSSMASLGVVGLLALKRRARTCEMTLR